MLSNDIKTITFFIDSKVKKNNGSVIEDNDISCPAPCTYPLHILSQICDDFRKIVDTPFAELKGTVQCYKQQ